MKEPVVFSNYRGTTIAAICTDLIRDIESREMVTRELKSSGREIIYLSFEEVQKFAGNCLELRTRNEEKVLAISHTAVQGLRLSNLATLQKHLRFIEVNIDTIESIGGGGIRCMLAGVHLTNLLK